MSTVYCNHNEGVLSIPYKGLTPVRYYFVFDMQNLNLSTSENVSKTTWTTILIDDVGLRHSGKSTEEIEMRLNRGKLWIEPEYERSLLDLLWCITSNVPKYPKTIAQISVSEWVDMFLYNTGHQLFQVEVLCNPGLTNAHLEWLNLEENKSAVKGQTMVLHGTSYESAMNIGNEGVKLELGKRHVHGPGFYVSTNICESLRYTDQPHHECVLAGYMGVGNTKEGHRSSEFGYDHTLNKTIHTLTNCNGSILVAGHKDQCNLNVLLKFRFDEKSLSIHALSFIKGGNYYVDALIKQFRDRTPLASVLPPSADVVSRYLPAKETTKRNNGGSTVSNASGMLGGAHKKSKHSKGGAMSTAAVGAASFAPVSNGGAAMSTVSKSTQITHPDGHPELKKGVSVKIISAFFGWKFTEGKTGTIKTIFQSRGKYKVTILLIRMHIKDMIDKVEATNVQMSNWKTVYPFYLFDDITFQDRQLLAVMWNGVELVEVTAL